MSQRDHKVGSVMLGIASEGQLGSNQVGYLDLAVMGYGAASSWAG